MRDPWGESNVQIKATAYFSEDLSKFAAILPISLSSSLNDKYLPLNITPLEFTIWISICWKRSTICTALALDTDRSASVECPFGNRQRISHSLLFLLPADDHVLQMDE